MRVGSPATTHSPERSFQWRSQSFQVEKQCIRPGVWTRIWVSFVFFFFCNTWGIWRTFAGNYLKLDVVPSCQEMMATQSSLRLRPTLDLDPWDLVFLLITKFKFKRPQCRKSKCKWSMQTKRGFWIHVECFCFLKVSRLNSQKHSLNKPVSFILKPCLLLLAKPYLPHKELEKLIHAFITPHWTIVTLFTWASS